MELEKRLGWKRDSKEGRLCAGTYVDRPQQFPPRLSKDTLYLHADKAVLSETKPSVYTGHVIVAQPDSEMTANRAVTELNEDKNGLKSIKAFGDVNFRQPGLLVVANEADMTLPDQMTTLYNLVYRLTRESKSPYNPFWSPLPSRGVANTFKKIASDQYELTEASYTTCAPDDKSWFASARNMHIDTTTKTVVARQAYFSIAGIPLLYTPYLSFSYDNAPRSGFLIPTFTNTSRGGTQFGLPFYWYAAPNTTLLFTTSYWPKRGSEFTTDLNYLTWNSKGEFYFDILPHDPVFASYQAANTSRINVEPGLLKLKQASTTRNYLFWQQQTVFNPYWTSKTNLNYVSDDYYFQDFGGNTLSQYTMNQLPQQSSLEYHGPHWSFLGSLQNYQTLHPINTPFIPDQYARTPQLTLNGYYPDSWGGLTYGLQFDFVNFTAPWLLNQPSAAVYPSGFPPIGQRFNVAPVVSFPFRRPGGYITPQVQFQNTSYNLNGLNNAAGISTGVPTVINRSIPLFSIDSGLYFDRDFQFGNETYRQTFEPRLFYLYVPTQDQSTIPLFDTSAPLFTYNLIFQTNRFNGIDRISNANQIGVGITSRLIDDATGFNRLIANVGQLYYLANRNVPLTQTSPNDKTTLSPVAGELTYFVNKAISITGNLAWNPNYNFLQNGIVNLAYKSDERHIFNVGATYQRVDALDPGIAPINSANNIKQLVSSAYWPLSLKWNAVAAVTYNLQQKYAMNYLGGLEYNTCCWAVRLVASSNFIGANQNNSPMYNNVYYVQFLLKGFTSLGFNQQNNLASLVPGFVDRMQ